MAKSESFIIKMTLPEIFIYFNVAQMCVSNVQLRLYWGRVNHIANQYGKLKNFNEIGNIYISHEYVRGEHDLGSVCSKYNLLRKHGD